MGASARKAVALTVVVSLLTVAAAYGLENLSLDYIKGKFEPWLWDKLQQFEANGTSRLMIVIVCVAEGSSYDSRQQFAIFLASRHNADIQYVGTVLDFITIQVMSTELRRIATYGFVKLLGDGERTGDWDLP